MPSDTRYRILEGALNVLRRGEPVTLDSASREVTLTKPGLMYHFPTKEALMLALVDHVATRWVEKLASHLDGPVEDAAPIDRIRAYVDFAFTDEFDETDIVTLSDPRLRVPLAERWVEQIGPWIALPNEMPERTRARLTAARLLSDGAWLAASTNVFAPADDERRLAQAVAYELLDGED